MLASDSLNNSLPTQEMSHSDVNWDMEHHHISLDSPKCSQSEMEISNTNTPRSRIFPGQRKKLSDSFTQEQFEYRETSESSQEKICRKNDEFSTNDAGYHTGSTFTFEESTWNSNTHLFASTPTKNKKQ